MFPIIKKINGENYIIPHSLKCNPHKHRDKKNWVALWFYKRRKRTEVLPGCVQCDKVITSKLEYQKDIFYKMSQMSEEDEYFDYYFRLKDEVKNKNLVKKNNRYKKGHPKHKFGKHFKFKPYQSLPLVRDTDGRVILRFA